MYWWHSLVYQNDIENCLPQLPEIYHVNKYPSKSDYRDLKVGRSV